MKQSVSLALLSALSLAACAAFFGTGPHVPSAYKGTTQITVANAGPHPICLFSLFEDAGRPVDNWLGDKSKKQDLAPGASRTFDIKPGVYHVMGGYCVDGQPVAAVGTYGTATASIDGPSLIALGPNPVPPVAGQKTLAFTKIYTVPAAGAGGGGGGGGEEEPAAAEEPAGSSEASSSSASSSSSSEAPAPSGPKCLPHGAVCNDADRCCPGESCHSRTKYSDGSLGNGYCE